MTRHTAMKWMRQTGAGLVFMAAGLPAAAAQTATTPQEMAAANFRLADADANNGLSAAEFAAFIDLNAAQNIGRAGRVKAAGAYGQAFARLDRNGDGLVSPDELAQAGQ
ncbi:MAG: hypothetical protein KKB02_07505 [Alphaproteobacteria bacterium]|nr:hypothetical protein [Alphaproteobacteria bacterium]